MTTKTSIETYKKAYNIMKAKNKMPMTFDEYLKYCERRLERARQLGLIV